MIVLDENVVSGKGMLLSDRGDCAQDASMIVNVDLFGDCAGETYFVRESARLLADGPWFEKRLDPNSLS